MALPTKIAQIVRHCFSAHWNATIQPTMRAVMVKILLITEKLPLQICGRPKESLIQELPAYASDQPLQERVRNWNMGNGLDFFNLQYSQICNSPGTASKLTDQTT